MTLGEYLRERRTEKKIGLRQMAKLMHIDCSHLCRVENGEREPSADLLASYSRHLRLDKNESDLMFALAGRLPPDIAPLALHRKGIYQFMRDNLTQAENESGAINAMRVTTGKT